MNAMVFPTAAFGRTYSRQNKGRSSNGSSVVGSKNDIVAGGVSAETTVALQLNRRGRLVLLGIPAITLAAVLMFASLAFVFGSMAAPAHASAAYPAVDMADYARTVTVLQGESLWSIAAASNPHGNVREVVREIVALNELGTGVLQAGQQLFVPLPK